jgi:quercetin dioxygenase-like cupin family protein
MNPMKKTKTRTTGKKAAGRGGERKKSKTSARKGAARHLTLSKTLAKGTGELRHVAWSAIEIEELNPLLGRQFVVGQNVMVARVLLKKGCLVPEHSHPNEQVSYILEGAVKFGINGREIVVSAGEVLTIPPNMPHWALAMEDTVDLDIFDPPRRDWMEKRDGYLR